MEQKSLEEKSDQPTSVDYNTRQTIMDVAKTIEERLKVVFNDLFSSAVDSYIKEQTDSLKDDLKKMHAIMNEMSYSFLGWFAIKRAVKRLEKKNNSVVEEKDD